MCAGVGPSGLPMLMSMTSSPERRAAIFSSLVMLKTYGGRRLMRANSLMGVGLYGIAAALIESRCGAKSYNVTGHLQHRQTLKLHLESPGALNTFTGYGDGYVMVNGERIEKSVVVLPERILADWPAASFADLKAEHFAALTGLGREIVLLATGAKLRF